LNNGASPTPPKEGLRKSSEIRSASYNSKAALYLFKRNSKNRIFQNLPI